MNYVLFTVGIVTAFMCILLLEHIEYQREVQTNGNG